MAGARKARLQDVHDIASAMPNVKFTEEKSGVGVYSVGGKSFVFFRNPRPDAVDPATGERLRDVIVVWTESLETKAAMVQDENSPWFTTKHFDGYRAVLVQAGRLGELRLDELTEAIQDAWLARASATRGRRWLAAQGLAAGPTA